MPSRLLVIALTALLAALAAAPAQGANPWLKRRVLDIAHQGGEDEFPSNTMFAFKRATRAGADMLELDVGVTRDDRIVVMHDTTLDRTTNGRGTIASHTLRQNERLDGAYWFSGGRDAYDHSKPRTAYRYRGIATGRRRPPCGFTRRDFRVPTLRQVLTAFPRTPINIEIKGRTRAERTEEYLRNARVLARYLRTVHRRDLIVVSFKQPAVDLFHRLVPRIGLAPGTDGIARWLLGGIRPGPGTVAFQVPITYRLGGQFVRVTTSATVAKAHAQGFAWHNWFGDEDVDGPATWRRLVDECVDGIMTSRPAALARVLARHPAPRSCR